MVTDGAPEDYRDVSSSGTNTYYVISFKAAVAQIRQRGEQVGDNDAGGLVLRRETPNYSTFNPAGPIWLTFASSRYFAQHNTNQPIEIPAGLLTDSGHDVDLRSVTRFGTYDIDQGTRLPRTLVLHEPGKGHGPIFPNGSYESISFPPPYNNGFTNLIFSVTAKRHFHSIELPETATLNTMWMKPGGTMSSDLWTRIVSSIVVTNVDYSMTTLEFPPAVPGVTALNDARFYEEADARQPIPIMANHHFPTDAQLRTTKGFESAQPAPKLYDVRRQTQAF